MKNKKDLEQLKIIENNKYQESTNFSEENPVYKESQYFPFDNKKPEEFATDNTFVEQEGNKSENTINIDSSKTTDSKVISSNISSVLTSVAVSVAAVILVVATVMLMSDFPLKYRVEYQILSEFIEFRINVDGEEGYENYAHLYNDDLTFDFSYPLEYGENFVGVELIEENSKYYFEIICIKQDTEERRIFEQLIIDIPEKQTDYFEIGFIEAFEYGIECMVFVNSPYEINCAVLNVRGDKVRRELTHGENMIWFDDLYPNTEYLLEFVTYDVNTEEEIVLKTLKVTTREAEEETDYFEIYFIEAFEYGLECMVIVNSPYEINCAVLNDARGCIRREQLTQGQNMIWFDDLSPNTEYVLQFIVYNVNIEEEIVLKTLKVTTREAEEDFGTN